MSISAVMNCESSDDTEMNFSRVEFLLGEWLCLFRGFFFAAFLSG